MVQLSKSKEEIIAQAAELAAEYERMYLGCTQTAFLSIIDALRWGGFEIIPPDIEDRLFIGVSTLSAGVGLSGRGSCGALSGAAIAIGLAVATLKGAAPRDMMVTQEACMLVRNGVMAALSEKYGSLRCLDVQLLHFGKAYDFLRDDMTGEFLSITDGCIIPEVARLAVAGIIDEITRS